MKGLFAPFLASQAHLSRSKNRKRSYPGRAPQQQQSTTKIQPHGISFSPENQHVPKLKEKPPPPRPTVQAERNGDEGGSVASDRWPKALPEINKENFAQPTPNFLYSWKWLIPKTLDGTSSPLPRCKGAQQVQCPRGIYKNKVLGQFRGKTLGKWGCKRWPCAPISLSTLVPQQVPGSFWEWEGAGRRKHAAQPGMDYLSKLKAAVCSLLHQRSGKNFQLRLPGGKAKNLRLNSNGFWKKEEKKKINPLQELEQNKD